MAKERLDVLLVKQGMVESREKARALIMAGNVYINNQKADKAGTMVKEDAVIRVDGGMKYVSRGGLKLEKAMETFPITLDGKVMMDIGASTGGFTDCGLQNGAVKVFAVDVGYGQLAWSLRTDERVVNMERTNIRNVTLEDIGQAVDFISIDVAFISLDKVLPVAATLLKEDGELVALIKPQFEAGREKVGKKGVVRDPAVHREVIVKVYQLSQELQFHPCGLTYSPVKGPEGNIEYLIHLKKEASDTMVVEADIDRVVDEAHAQLDK